MDGYTYEELEAALNAITSMIERSEKAWVKFAEGTSQYSLQKNRVKALCIGASLVRKEMGLEDLTESYAEEDFEKAVAPITSLIHKSEKASRKLDENGWQYKMLTGNIKALHIVLPLLQNR